MYDDHLLTPWFEHARAAVPEAPLFDVHTHIGANDPDGFKLSGPQLVAELDAVAARAVIIPTSPPGTRLRTSTSSLRPPSLAESAIGSVCCQRSSFALRRSSRKTAATSS